MIGSLGRLPTEDKLTIYIKQESEPDAKDATESISISSTARRGSGGSDATSGGSASRLLSRYRQQGETSLPNDLLRTIEEVDPRNTKNGAKDSYDRSPGILPPPSASSSNDVLLSASDRDKRKYQRTMVTAKFFHRFCILKTR